MLCEKCGSEEESCIALRAAVGVVAAQVGGCGGFLRFGASPAGGVGFIPVPTGQDAVMVESDPSPECPPPLSTWNVLADTSGEATLASASF